MDTPLVCVIVLNYNGRQHLTYCLPSIQATDYPSFQMIVVDNASADDSVQYVTQHFPEVVILQSPTNRGWSGGNNLGIRHAQELGAQFVILANNDIRVDTRWIRAAVEAAQQDPRTGIIGFRVLEPRDSTDQDAGFRQAVADWTSLHITESRPVGGMAIFLRLSMLEHIGMIDEGYFAYAEENDLERRARKAGYRVLTTNVPVWHHGQGTFGRTSLRAATLQIRNNIRLSIKHDHLLGVVYQIARHFAKACLPFVTVDHTDRIARRLRPSNIFVNFAIWLYALAWNAWHLPATLHARHEDERKVQSARRHLAQL